MRCVACTRVEIGRRRVGAVLVHGDVDDHVPSVARTARFIWQAHGVGQPLVLYSAAELDAHMTRPGIPSTSGGSTRRSPGSTTPGCSTPPCGARRPRASDDDWRSSTTRPTSTASRRSASAAAASLDPDTMVSPGSFATARRAAGGVLGVDRRAAGGRVRRRVLRGPTARPPRPARPGDGVLPVQQRRRRRPPRWPRRASGCRSSTGTSTTATAPRTSSTTTRASSTSRPTSRRCTRAPARLARPAAAPGRGSR